MDNTCSFTRLRLQQVADALGMPVEQFFAANAHSDVVAEAAETADCLDLWSRIRTAEGRRRVLDTLRVIVRAEGL